MTATGSPAFQTSSAVTPGSTAAGARVLRKALSRLETLATLALAIAVLAMAEAYLAWSGVFGHIPGAGAPLAEWWSFGVQVGIAVAFGVAIAVLVIIAVVTAVLGLISWRKGVLAMVDASTEYGPSHVEACRRARQDHSMTLWMCLVIVLAAIVVSILFVGINGALSYAGVGTLPGTAGSVATGLATGAVLIGVYYFGTRQIVELLSAVATSTQTELLGRGRNRMLAGAAVGLGAAFSSLSWGFDVFGILSLAIILAGVRDLGRAYDLWLAEHASPGAALAAPRPAVAQL